MKENRLGLAKGEMPAKPFLVINSTNHVDNISDYAFMDMAKTVWCLYEFPHITLDEIHAFRNDLYDMGKKAKMVAIPTTSGTGAETTFVTVISKYEDEIWKKYLYLHRGLIPTYAIVYPIFPVGMPPKLTVDTAFDALAHAIEGLGSLWKNEFSNGLALKAIEMIF